MLSARKLSAQKDENRVIRQPYVTVSCILVVFAAFVIGWAGWKKGRESGIRFAIHGPSMAPTLLGEHQIAECRACGIKWPIEISDSVRSVLCFHCGDQAKLATSERPASVVVVHAYGRAETGPSLRKIRIGDVVAIGGQNMMRIKRIAALPGERVELNGDSLIVNGETLQTRMERDGDLKIPLPTLLFEMDNRRELSRWHGDGWQRSEQRTWTTAGSDWLTYHHQCIHHGNQPSGVWDDYPYNAGLNRKLLTAKRLVLSADAIGKDTGRLEVAFWIDNQILGLTCDVGRKRKLDICSDDAIAINGAPVSAETPVAIRVVQGNVQLSCLQLARQIEYRLRPHDDRSTYPISLGSNEFFVVGDNVPVSLDSRDFGVIDEGTIKGLVELVEPQ